MNAGRVWRGDRSGKEDGRKAEQPTLVLKNPAVTVRWGGTEYDPPVQGTIHTSLYGLPSDPMGKYLHSHSQAKAGWCWGQRYGKKTEIMRYNPLGTLKDSAYMCSALFISWRPQRNGLIARDQENARSSGDTIILRHSKHVGQEGMMNTVRYRMTIPHQAIAEDTVAR